MHRVVKAILWCVGGLVAALLLAVVAILLLGNSDAGRTWLASTLRRVTANHVQISALGGSFPEHLTLQELQLTDDDGVWLTARGIKLDWRPTALLHRWVRIENLQMSSLALERMPHSAKTSGSQSNSSSIPHIDAQKIQIGSLQLSSALAGAPTVLQLDGSLRLNSLADMRVDAHAQRTNGDGDYQLHADFDAKQLDATLALHEPASGPLENLAGLPGLGALSAQLSLHGPRSAEQLQLSLQAGASSANASGRVDLNRLSADLTFAVASVAERPRPGLAWHRAAVQGTWHGQTASVDATVEGLAIPGAAGDMLTGVFKLGAAMRFDDALWPVDLTVTHKLLSLQAHATAGSQKSATIELRLPDLAPWAALASQQVRGSAVVTGRWQQHGTQQRISVDANGTLSSHESWAPLIGEHLKITAGGVYDGGLVQLDHLLLHGEALNLSATGELGRLAPGALDASRTVKANWTATLPDVARVVPSVAGTLKASGMLSGALGDLRAQADADANLAVRGTTPGPMTAHMDLRGFPAAPSGSLTASGSLDGAALNVKATAQRDRTGALHARLERAQWQSVSATGQYGATAGGRERHGEFSLQIANLTNLNHLLGTQLGGALSAGAALRPERNGTAFKVELDSANLSVNGILASVQVRGDGSADSLPLHIVAHAPQVNGAPADVNLTANLALNERRLLLSTLAADYRGQHLTLTAPAHFSFAEGLGVDQLQLSAQQAQLDVRGTLSPQLALRVNLKNVQPALINAFAPNLLTAGVVDARGDLHGSLAAPTGTFALNANGMRFADEAGFGLAAVDVHANAHLLGETADVNAKLSAGADSQLSAVGRVPLAAEGAVSLQLSGMLSAALFNPILEAGGRHASGHLTLDATVAGTAQAPQIGGTVTVAQGALQDYVYGVNLTDIKGSLVGSEGTLKIQSMTASAAPGTLSLSGTVGVLQPHIPIDITVAGHNAQPVASKLITANLDTTLHITGDARTRLDIAGNVHLNRTVIGIPNALPPSVETLDVRRAGVSPATSSAQPLVVGLNITVDAPNEILVQGRGLDAEMGGKLHVTGTTADPLVSGDFELQRGNFAIGSSKLNFTAGRVRFNGTGPKNKLDPSLDFTAQAVVLDSTDTLTITGFADAPRFDFSSSPAMPQDEILSRLLFGVPAAQLTALQVAQIGYALATLSGVGSGGGGSNPLVRLQRSLGLDRLSVGSGTPTNGSTESSGASIEAGRYISKRVYVEARQSTQGASQLQADVDLTKRLKLRTRLGNGTASVQGTNPENDPGSSVGLIYQFEY